jgi:hypothetical protein
MLRLPGAYVPDGATHPKSEWFSNLELLMCYPAILLTLNGAVELSKDRLLSCETMWHKEIDKDILLRKIVPWQHFLSKICV